MTGSPQSVPAPRRGRLLQVLGIAFGLAVIIGNTIGVGILRTPGDVATQLPSTPLFIGVWVAGGIYALLGALTLAELGAMIPESGGQYVFARRALGDYAGFMIGWSDWVSSCASMAAVTISMGDYSDVLWPVLSGHALPIAIGVTVVLTLIQARGIRAGDLTQQITSLLKALVLVGLAVVCIFWPAHAAAPGPALAPPPTGSLLLAFGPLILALQGVIYTYDGWNGMLYFSGEVKNPGRCRVLQRPAVRGRRAGRGIRLSGRPARPARTPRGAAVGGGSSHPRLHPGPAATIRCSPPGNTRPRRVFAIDPPFSGPQFRAMRVVNSAAEMQRLAQGRRLTGTRVGFVPTMGCLHDGHLSLVRAARRRVSPKARWW